MYDSEQVVFEQGELRVLVSPTLHPAAMDLLRQTEYGTSGIRYRQQDQLVRVRDLAHPRFFLLWRSAHLLGMYCLDERQVWLDGRWLPAFYGRYLTVSAAHMGQGYGHLLKQQAIQYVERTTSSPCLLYCFIEQKNTRSSAISLDEGFTAVATLRTTLFFHGQPEIDPRVEPAAATDLPAIKSILFTRYQNHHLLTLERIGYQQGYFVLREAGVIVAGVQAIRVHWCFTHIPEPVRSMLRLVLPKRFFNPDQQPFAVLEGVYLAEGHHQLWPVLLESVLAHLAVHGAMWQPDEADHGPSYRRTGQPWLKISDRGLSAGLQLGIRTGVLVKPMGMAMPWIFPTGPVYASCFDYA